MTRHEQYATDLVRVQGKEDAIRIASHALQISRTQGAALTTFGEADFVVSDYGKYEFAKVQSKTPFQFKDKRIKANINFWALVLQILTKTEKKNVSKN